MPAWLICISWFANGRVGSAGAGAGRVRLSVLLQPTGEQAAPICTACCLPSGAAAGYFFMHENTGVLV